jgi:hypothetical protein
MLLVKLRFYDHFMNSVVMLSHPPSNPPSVFTHQYKIVLLLTFRTPIRIYALYFILHYSLALI